MNPPFPASGRSTTRATLPAAFRLPAARTVALAALLGAIASALPTAMPTARAASFIWQGGGGNTNWSTGNNWTGNAAPANNGTADLFFGNSANGNSTSVTPAYSVRSLTWETAANTYLFLGNQLTLGAGGLAQNANNAQILNVPVALGATQTWSLNVGSGSLTFNNGAVNNNGYALTINAGGGNVINGGFSGAGSLTKTGTGTLTLGGASTYTGNTNISAGALTLTGSLTSGSGATLGLGSTTAAVSSAGTLNLGTGASVSVGAAYVGGYGAGTVNQSGGSFTTNGGDLSITPVGATSTYNLSGGTLTTGRTLVGDDNSNTTGVFNQTGGTHTTGTLALSLFNQGTTNGTYNLTGGILNAGRVIGHDPAYATSGNSVFNFNGGTLQASASRSDFMADLAAANVQAGGAKIDTAGFSVTIAQGLAHDATLGATADGGLLKTGAGTLTLTGNNTYTGGTTFAAGTIQAGSAGALGGGGTLSFTGGTLQYSPNNTTDYSGRFSTAAGQAFSIDTNGQSVTFASGLNSGGSSLTKLGAGTLTLTRTYTGTTTISAGTLQLGNGGTTGGLSSSSGTITDNGTLAFNRSDNVPLPNVVTGTGNLVQSGTGTLILTAANTYAGTTTISAGTLSVGNNGSTGTLGGGDVTNNAALVFNRSNDLTVANAIGGTGSLTKNGLATLTLTGASTYTGATAVNAGTLAVTSGGSLTGAGDINVNGRTTLALSGTGSVATASGRILTVDSTSANAASVTLADGASLTADYVLIGNNGLGSVTQSGCSFTANSLILGNNAGSSGTYTLSGAGSTLFTGQAIVGFLGSGTFNQSGGIFTTNGSNVSLGFSGGSGTYNLTGGSLSAGGGDVGLVVSSTFNQSGGSFTTNGGNLFLGSNDDANGTYNLSGGSLTTGLTQVSAGANTSVFTQSGGTHTTGTLALSGYNTAANGTYHLDGGTLSAGSVVGHGVVFDNTAGTSTFNFNGGTLQASASRTDFMAGLTTASVQAGGAKIDTAGFDVTVAQPLLHDPATGTTDGGLTKLGGGTLTLTGASTYAGATTVNVGTLAVISGGSLAGGNVNVQGAGSTLALSGTGRVSPGGGSQLTVDGGFIFNSGTASVTLADGASLSTGTAIIGNTGVGVVTQTGGTFTTNGSALNLGGYINGSSNGAYNLNGGTLTVGRVASLGGTSTFNLNGGTLRPSASTTTFLQGLTVANVQAGGAVIDTAGNNVTVAQALVHAAALGASTIDGGLTKLGAGTLTLTAANTFTGPTVVSAGTLLVHNTAGSATGTGPVTVQNGATLGGDGALTGPLTVQNGATLSPGMSPGRLTLGGNLSLAVGANLTVELGGTTAGSQYDQVALGGTLSVLGANLNVAVVGGFTLAVGQTFFILDRTGADVSLTGTFANAPGGLYTDAAGDTFLINYAATNPADGDLLPNDVSLTVAAVPEPATWALLMVGGAAGLTVGVRRRASARCRAA